MDHGALADAWAIRPAPLTALTHPTQAPAFAQVAPEPVVLTADSQNALHQKALGAVSWSPMDASPSTIHDDTKADTLGYPWPWWADLPMKECIDHYETALKEAARGAESEEAAQERVMRMRAHLAENDLFFLLIDVLRRKDMIHPWLYARCREFQRHPNGYLDLWARYHYKSTIITFAGTILSIIRDQEVTIGIFSHTKPIAKAFLRQIKTEFETNENLKRLWPDVFWENPAKQSTKWSEDEGITVKRRGNPKEATLEASGLVDGQPTSKHYLIRVYDDVVTRESVYTPEQIIKTTDAWELSSNLGTEGGVSRYAGTRYHLFDTYRTIMDRGSVKPRIYPATDDGMETGRPILLSPEHFAEIRRDQGVYTFACQMLQNPLADRAMGFRNEWLADHYMEITHLQAMGSLARIIIVDPAGSKKRKGNDYTTMWVLGLGADSKWRVLEFIRDRLNLTERTAALIALHRHWKPLKVGYEEYGMQADIEHIEYVQKQETYTFEIMPLGGQMSKANRILRLVPYFENGRIHFPLTMLYKDGTGRQVDLVQTFIQEEYSAFPVCHHDDMLDALSRLCDEEMAVQPPIITANIIPRQFDLTAALGQHGISGSGVSGSDWLTA